MGCGNNHHCGIWRLHSGYNNWTDNCDIRDVLRNWYRCSCFRCTFPEKIQRVESRFKSKSEVKSRLQGDETKTAIQNKIGEMEKLTEEDFEAHFVILYYFRIHLFQCRCALVPQEYIGHFSILDS